MKKTVDHRSYAHNLNNCEIRVLRKFATIYDFSVINLHPSPAKGTNFQSGQLGAA